ncbi:maleylpyruvate isomerase family mycothiol-dependent enzyme [Nocardia sp. NPDC004151]|uniref:maleylpyruvate isomerase family mycothiol-dependent enzyme n=1 Tax=Nocardia sp. NPDC004151 TaxID=3364304 RepID=UPI003692221C
MTTPTLTTEQIWRAVAAERISLHDLLDSLSEAQWNHQSLCADWRIRDVVAHVVLSAQPSTAAILIGLVRAGGNLHTMIRDTAIRHAATSTTTQLLDELRATVPARATALGSTPADRLMDLLVHGQDITIPLGIPRDVPIDAARVSLDRICAAGTFGIRETLARQRLVATDTEWAAGGGLPVRAPIGELLLLATGRSRP